MHVALERGAEAGTRRWEVEAGTMTPSAQGVPTEGARAGPAAPAPAPELLPGFSVHSKSGVQIGVRRKRFGQQLLGLLVL